jgi:hypothetical protein
MATVVVETPVQAVSLYSRPWLSLYNVRLKPKPAIVVAEVRRKWLHASPWLRLAPLQSDCSA